MAYIYPSGLSIRSLLKAGCSTDIECGEVECEDCYRCVLHYECVDNMTDEEAKEVLNNILNRES